VRSEASDNLDETPLPAPLPLVRFCSAAGCKGRARPGGRYCASCHTAAVRRWRASHRRELTARRQAAAAGRNAESRARDSARAKLAMALRRGTLKRGCCIDCGADQVVGLIADSARWRDVVWVCREHREGELGRRQDAEARRLADAKQAAWYEERGRVLAAIDLLPPVERARLEALAERGPAGVRLSPDAPLYVMNLVRVYSALFSGTLG